MRIRRIYHFTPPENKVQHGKKVRSQSYYSLGLRKLGLVIAIGFQANFRRNQFLYLRGMLMLQYLPGGVRKTTLIK
jgi:hypothetical protein